jgi:hypothetical protein
MFDTHRYYHALKNGGFTGEQAETLTTALVQAVGISVASKADVERLGADLRAEIAALRLDMERNARNLYLQVVGTVGVMLAIAQYAGQHLR